MLRRYAERSSTSSLLRTDAQIRYANGAISILDNWLNGKAQLPANVIVENGDYATKAYGQREKK
jgi:formate dehydrogenase